MHQATRFSGFDVLATLGTGARSTIYAVRDNDHHLYALKHVVRERSEDQRFILQAITEHEIASRFDHPALRKSFHLRRIRKIFRVTEVIVLMELVDGHCLEDHPPDSILEGCMLCRQVAEGLAHMHRAGYVHADIKPNNVLVTDRETVKIIDLGQSCPIGTVKKRVQGTPDYIAPEQVLRRSITPRTDVFNLGATMYWLFTRRHVPTLIPRGEPGTGVREDDCPPPAQVNPRVPPALSALVNECIATEPDRRPATMKVVAERLDLAIAQLRRAASAAQNAMAPTK